MTILDQGWILARPELPNMVLGVEVPPETRTRKEEYSFVVETLAQEKGATVCDLATGYVQNWHLLALILARAGWQVIASDKNPGVMLLPKHDRVTYLIADACDTGLPSETFDVVTCISTLEHCTREETRKIAAEMKRLVKPGGLLIATADLSPWLPVLFGGTCQPSEVPEGSVFPPVYYVVARAT